MKRNIEQNGEERMIRNAERNRTLNFALRQKMVYQENTCSIIARTNQMLTPRKRKIIQRRVDPTGECEISVHAHVQHNRAHANK